MFCSVKLLLLLLLLSSHFTREFVLLLVEKLCSAAVFLKAAALHESTLKYFKLTCLSFKQETFTLQL